MEYVLFAYSKLFGWRKMKEDANSLTIKYYDQFASDFEKIPFDKTIRGLFTQYAPSEDKKLFLVLDVGSGPGALANWIHQMGLWPITFQE